MSLYACLSWEEGIIFCPSFRVWLPLKIIRNSSGLRQPLSRGNLTGFTRLPSVYNKNISLRKKKNTHTYKHTHIPQTSWKIAFAQISLVNYPKSLTFLNFWEGCKLLWFISDLFQLLYSTAFPHKMFQHTWLHLFNFRNINRHLIDWATQLVFNIQVKTSEMITLWQDGEDYSMNGLLSSQSNDQCL